MTTEKVVCPEGWWPTLLLSNTVTPLNGCPLAPSLPPRSPKHQVFLHPHVQTLPPLPELTYYCLQTLLPSLDLGAASTPSYRLQTSLPPSRSRCPLSEPSTASRSLLPLPDLATASRPRCSLQTSLLPPDLAAPSRDFHLQRALHRLQSLLLPPKIAAAAGPLAPRSTTLRPACKA
jgi:hypothetical protein